MYVKPSLTRYGSFREVTRGGSSPGIGDITHDWRDLFREWPDWELPSAS